MTQSSTITVVDKQRLGQKPKSPFKILAEGGEEFKAWADVGFKLMVGETYDVGIEEKASTNPEYPAPDYFIVKYTKANGQAAPAPKAAPFKGNGTQTDWNEVGIQKHTGELFAVMWAPNRDPAALLDECRAIWIAHVARSKTPTVKLVTKSELHEDDYDDFK